MKPKYQYQSGVATSPVPLRVYDTFTLQGKR